MNHYSARKLEDSGLWHYTCLNKNHIWAVGYCSPWKNCPDCDENELPLNMGGPDCLTCNGKRLVPNPNPCKGHETAEEAELHYKEYILDHLKFTNKSQEWPKYKCECDDCNQEGILNAVIDDKNYILCETHANRESVSKMINVGDCWCS